MKTYITAFVICLGFVSSVTVSKESEIYRAVVSFYSICCGPDRKDIEAVQEFIKEYEHKYKVKLVFENRSWGLEGEWDMCFKLDEVNSTAQIKFVNGVKEAIERLKGGKDNSRDGGAKVYENKPCN